MLLSCIKQITISVLIASSFPVPAQSKVYVSPDNRLRAVIVYVGKKNFEDQESRIEIRDARGRLLRWRSFASPDGEHGLGVHHAEWSTDGRFLVFNGFSSGGHQPWKLPTYFYSRRGNRFYSLGDFVGPITSDFDLVGQDTVIMTRFNFDKNEERERIKVRLGNLHRRRKHTPYRTSGASGHAARSALSKQLNRSVSRR